MKEEGGCIDVRREYEVKVECFRGIVWLMMGVARSLPLLQREEIRLPDRYLLTTAFQGKGLQHGVHSMGPGAQLFFFDKLKTKRLQTIIAHVQVIRFVFTKSTNEGTNR